MGEPKGLLELEGVSFARRVVRALRQGGCQPVIFVTRVDDRDTAREAEDEGAWVLPNPDPRGGPITSLRVALAWLGDAVERVAYLPLDHPAVRPETVRLLVDEARRRNASLALPIHRGERGHPAVFARALFAELLDPQLEGGARTVVHRHLDTAHLVETDDPGVLVDVDTPAEYDALVDGDAGERRPGPDAADPGGRAERSGPGMP